MRVQHDVPLASCTTIRLGGPAATMIDVTSEDELVLALAEAKTAGAPVFILGGGSNVVVSDAGWPGVVLRIGLRGRDATREGDRVVLSVAAGEPWDDVVGRSVDDGWGGIECLSGIPGLAGATPIQNVGAYGQEVSDTILRVRAYDRSEQKFVEIERFNCGFAYRESRFRGSDRYVVTRVDFALAVAQDGAPMRYAELARALGVQVGNKASLRSVRDAVLSLRRTKGMICDPTDPESVSAGSFFTNPVLGKHARDVLERSLRRDGVLRREESLPGFDAGLGRWKISAAWLIERAGFTKGLRRGGVGISMRHALALVNRGGTTAELLAFADEICAGVEAKFSVSLQREPVAVGS